MNRYLIPMFALAYAASADEATMKIGDFCMGGINRTAHGDIALRMCEASDNHLIAPTASPHDLTEFLPAGVAGELERLRELVQSQAQEITKKQLLLERCGEVLDSLVEECNSNAYFATTSRSESEALENAESLQGRLGKIDAAPLAALAA